MRSAAFILVAIGVLTKAILTFSYNKLVAHGLDPSGYFAYGKLYLVATFMYTVASLGLANAHTVYLSGDRSRTRRFDSAVWFVFIGASFVSLFFYLSVHLFDGALNQWVGRSTSMSVWLVLTSYIVLSPITIVFSSWMGVLQDYKFQQAASLFPSLIAVLFLVGWSHVSSLSIEVAIAAYCLGYISLGIGILVWRGNALIKAAKVRRILIAGKFYSSYVLPSLAGTIVSTVVFANIMTRVGVGLDGNSSGVWYAVWRLSEAYTGLIIAIGSAFFLPKMVRAGIGDKKIAWLTLGALLAAYFPLFLGLLSFPKFVFGLLFSQQFALSLPSLVPQVLGDLLKIIVAVIMFRLVVAKRPFFMFVVECVFSLTFFGLVEFLARAPMIESYLWAYALSYAFLLIGLVPGILFVGKRQYG